MTEPLAPQYDPSRIETDLYRFWAEKLRYRACQWRGGMNCVEPKA